MISGNGREQNKKQPCFTTELSYLLLIKLPRYTLISSTLLQKYKLFLKSNNPAPHFFRSAGLLFYSPGLRRAPLEIILSTYALSPKTEPAQIRVCAKYHNTLSEISPTGSVKNPMKERITPVVRSTRAEITCAFFMVYSPSFLELVEAEGGCNGCEDSDYNVDDSAPQLVFVFCHNRLGFTFSLLVLVFLAQR